MSAFSGASAGEDLPQERRAFDRVDVAYRFAWPYDEALAELEAARARVQSGGAPIIFVGAHAEEVVTLGRHAGADQLLFQDALVARGVLVRRIDRGGGATAHGPGQIVLYPVLPLVACGLSIPALTAHLLEAASAVAAELIAEEKSVLPCSVQLTVGTAPAGLYANGGKLASVGFRVERGVTTHGVALNVCNTLETFALIAPCGIRGQEVARLCEFAPSAKVRDVGERLGFHFVRRAVLEQRSA